jgi:hypothetical protein
MKQEKQSETTKSRSNILPNWIEDEGEYLLIGRTDDYESTHVAKKNLSEFIQALEEYCT